MVIIQNGFPVDNNSIASFKFKTKITGRIGNNSTKNVKIWLPLRYFRNFWRTPTQIPLINCEVNLVLTWSGKCFIIDAPIANRN